VETAMSRSGSDEEQEEGGTLYIPHHFSPGWWL
jgi:hypothetical protein